MTIALLASTVACGEDGGEKPEAPTPDLTDGKADGLDVRDGGELGFGDDGALENAIPPTLRYDAYEIEVAEGAVATFEISQRGTSRGFDSLLYIFGPRDTDGRYPSDVIARDDDNGWGLLSRIRDFEFATAGTYMIAVGSFEGEGQYRIQAECENGSCIPPTPTGECAFGQTYRDIVNGRAPALTLTYDRVARDSSELSEIETAQLVDSLNESGASVATGEEAMQNVDLNEVNLLHVWDVSNKRAYEVVEYGLGDTSVGAIYEAGTTERAAVISDSDIYECEAIRGDERRDCATNEDCAEGLACEGRVNGLGSCIDGRFSPPGDQDTCTTSLDCPDSNGLVCAGENIGGGFCSPAWMRRHFVIEPQKSIEGASASVTLDTYGLASVHTDVNLDLYITHDDFSQLRVTLRNPSGTEHVVHDQDGSVTEIFVDRQAVRAFPGDEDANGTWTLNVENLDPVLTGSVHEFGLEVTSRWD